MGALKGMHHFLDRAVEFDAENNRNDDAKRAGEDQQSDQHIVDLRYLLRDIAVRNDGQIGKPR